MTNMDPLAQAAAMAESLKSAQAAAAAAANTTGTAIVPTSPASPPALPGRRLSMDDQIGSALVVEKWLKLVSLKGAGAMLGVGDATVDSFEANITFTPDVGFAKTYAVSYGNPVIYKKTYDGVLTHGGGNWSDAIETALRADPKRGRPYDSVDVVMELIGQIKNRKGEIVADEGCKIGWSASVTNYASWNKLFQTVKAAKLIGHTIRVKVTANERAANGNHWAVIDFEVVKN